MKKYVKLTLDLEYADHKQVAEILQAQKQPSQFIVNAILQSYLQVTHELPQTKTPLAKVTTKQPTSNLEPSDLDAVPKGIMSFLDD